MPPTLGATVLFAVLSNEPAQSFVAATGNPVGDAVIQPTAYPGGFRAATVVGIIGDGSSKRAALLVYKQPGDPFRSPDGADAFMQRLGDVPYSPLGIPGTWMHPQDADALKHRAPVAAAPATNIPPGALTVEQLTAMKRDDLFAHATERGIDLGNVTTLRDALPIVAKHYNLTLPV